MADEFTEGTRLTVGWTSIIPMKEMEHELRVLLAKYGLEFYASGSDLVGYRRELVFEVPVRKPHHVVIRWSGLIHINLEGQLERLLKVYGYTCTDKTREADDGDYELVFRQPI